MFNKGRRSWAKSVLPSELFLDYIDVVGRDDWTLREHSDPLTLRDHMLPIHLFNLVLKLSHLYAFPNENVALRFVKVGDLAHRDLFHPPEPLPIFFLRSLGHVPDETESDMALRLPMQLHVTPVAVLVQIVAAGEVELVVLVVLEPLFIDVDAAVVRARCLFHGQACFFFLGFDFRLLKLEKIRVGSSQARVFGLEAFQGAVFPVSVVTLNDHLAPMVIDIVHFEAVLKLVHISFVRMAQEAHILVKDFAMHVDGLVEVLIEIAKQVFLQF